MTTMPVDKGFFVTSPFGPRAGGYHWGTDYGTGGGSGNRPVYAVKDGRVKHSGPASGFGQWVTVDHPGSTGGGFTVYGHVIPEVKVGQWVKEGQRIARINPDSRTNGGVAPHLHIEWHLYTWSQPGPARLNPETMLKNARWPGNSVSPKSPAKAPAKSKDGLLFGLDVSEWQDGLYLGGVPDIGFVIARTTDGTHRDRAYRSHIDDAERAGLVTAAYHYLRAPSEGSSVAQQVAASLEVMGPRHKRPVWIDVETPRATLSPQDIRECKQLYEQAGVRVIGVYSYIPYWENQIRGGEPDTHQFGAVWVANYPNAAFVPFKQLWNRIPKDKFDYPIGNQKPVIWQYTGNGQVPGWPKGVDCNVFRGTKDDIRDLFYGTKTNHFTEEEMKELDDILKATTGKRKSLVNPKVELTPAQLISCIDAATWQNRVIVSAIADKLGLDVDQLVADAIAEDRAQH